MQPATRLYVSADPRRFADYGVLFEARLPAGESAFRFEYDHANAAASRVRLLAVVANAATAARTITLLGAAAGPAGDSPSIEAAVEARFRSAAATHAASRHVVAAGHVYVLCDAVLAPGERAAARYDVETLAGDGLYLRVIACDPSHHQLSVHAHLREIPADGSGHRGVFPLS